MMLKLVIKSGLHGDFPQADLRERVAEPNEAVPEFVLYKELIHGHPQVSDANGGNEDC